MIRKAIKTLVFANTVLGLKSLTSAREFYYLTSSSEGFVPEKGYIICKNAVRMRDRWKAEDLTIPTRGRLSPVLQYFLT
jgi:hypothetical protein